MHNSDRISESSRRIARNASMLYLRMLLMLAIGLFTSRIVLQSLGVSDYGVYNAVAGVVTVFTFLTSSIGNAISRFMAYELGKGDVEKLHKVFSTSIFIQIFACILMVVLVESAGLWMLREKMVIPSDRMQAAHIVLQCSLGVLVVNLMAVPYNAMIMANERMTAYAYISILEALLKIAVAALLFLSDGDRLVLYAFLMLGVSLVIRGTYAVFCRKKFPESRGRLQWDSSLVKEMSSFAGWSFLGSSAYVFNTQGLGIVMNLFFGVLANAARGIALQVEGIARQFTNNILQAFNPAMTKAWAEGRKEYAFTLVLKSSRYVSLVMLLLIIPFAFEAEELIQLWLGQLPEHSADFVRLTLVCLLLNTFSNPLHTLQQATGKIRKYYIITGITAYTALPLTYAAFKMGAAPEAAYCVLIAIYVTDCVEKAVILHKDTLFPVKSLLKDSLLGVLVTAALSFAVAGIPFFTMEEGWLRAICVCLSSWAATAVSAWFFATTPGEREFIKSKISTGR